MGVKDITGDAYPEIITGHNPSTGVRTFTVKLLVAGEGAEGGVYIGY